jgi:putative phage-type endonuclease
MTATAERTEVNWSVPAAKLVLTIADATDRDRWLKVRRSGLGGSDVATLMGHNKYSSPYFLWLDKTSTEAPVDDQSEAMWWGSYTEAGQAQQFEKKTGLATRRAGTYANRVEPWQMVNLDRLVTDGGILECKDHELMSDAAKVILKGDVTPAAMDQLQWGLGVTGRSHAWFVAKVGKTTHVIGPIDRDSARIEQLRSAAGTFWHDHVLTNTPPPVDYATVTDDEIAARWPTIDPDKIVHADPLVVEMELAALADAEAEAKKAKAIVESVKTRLKALAGDAELVLAGDRPAYRCTPNGTFAPTRFTKEHPDLADQFTITKPALDTKALESTYPAVYAEYRARVVRPIKESK